MKNTRITIWAIISIILFYSCNDNEKNKREKVVVQNYETGKTDTIPVFYFPDTLDMHIQGWYSRQLYAMEEPTLYDTIIENTEIYRFTYLPSFSMPLTIRIEHKLNDTIIFLYAKSHLGSGGYPPEEKGFDLYRKLPLYAEYNVWDSLQIKLDSLKFWKQHFEEKWDGDDGTMFIIEGVKDGQYKIIHRWSPRPEAFEKVDEFKSVCDYFHYLMLIGFDSLYWGGKWEKYK